MLTEHASHPSWEAACAPASGPCADARELHALGPQTLRYGSDDAMIEPATSATQYIQSQSDLLAMTQWFLVKRLLYQCLNVDRYSCVLA